MLTFGDSNKSCKLDGDLLKTMTNYNFNVDQSNPQDRKLIYEIRKEMKFNNEQVGLKSSRDISLRKLLESPAIRDSGISSKILPENCNELCDRIKLLIQEKQAGKNSNIIDD